MSATLLARLQRIERTTRDLHWRVVHMIGNPEHAIYPRDYHRPVR